MSDHRPIITLLTDFGTADTYAGQMRGVIATICPSAIVIDLTHAVRPQAIEQGAFLLESALPAFPPSAIHVAVVDPGVGTARSGLLIRAGERTLVGPDNGLLSCAISIASRPAAAGRIALPVGVQAFALRPPAGAEVSATFHGRDLFAPAAARLANGVEPATLGDPVDGMIALPPFRGRLVRDGEIEGRVVHIDRFGNLLTSIHRSQLRGDPIALHIGGTEVTTFARTYGDADGMVAVVGSSGFLEVALVKGSAAAALSVGLGEPVQLRSAEDNALSTSD